MDIDWKSDLEEWLAPFLGALGNKARSRMCPAYVAGLIGSGDRKSMQTVADRATGKSAAGSFITSWRMALECGPAGESPARRGRRDRWRWSRMG